jgi:ATP/maltotriose-dependent transcriptional regulator MalT
MEAFYVCIIFLGIILVAVSLFLILMDRANGKDFFKEFDRKKDEMFNLIQDSEEMLQELNQMSDYVVTVISEKNQEFINKSMNSRKEDKTPEAAKTVQQMPSETTAAAESVVMEQMAAIAEQAKPQAVPEPTEAPAFAPMHAHVINQPEAEKTVNAQMANLVPEKKAEGHNSGKSKLILNDKRREVIRLIEQGLNNDEIAAKMKIGKGEIGLIRGLSKQ